MKRVLMVSFFFLMISLFLGSSAPAQNVTGPRMILSETSHDFKEVEEGTVVEHSFKVVNRGDQVLQIKNVNPG